MSMTYKTAFVLLLFLVKPVRSLREVETARFEASFEISTKLHSKESSGSDGKSV